MKNLSSKEINLVMNALADRGISNVMRDELTDHICCETEALMSQGASFDESLEKALATFAPGELHRINKEVKNIYFQKLMKRTLSTTAGLMTAACLILFLTLSSFEPPSILPVAGDSPRISSDFGMRRHPIDKKMMLHKGIDLPLAEGTEIRATADGIVDKVFLEDKEGYGIHVIIKHDEEYSSLYASLSEISVAEGQEVKKGQMIALSGNSGTSTAPHLHYEVRYKNEPVDPQQFLK